MTAKFSTVVMRHLTLWAASGLKSVIHKKFCNLLHTSLCPRRRRPAKAGLILLVMEDLSDAGTCNIYSSTPLNGVHSLPPSVKLRVLRGENSSLFLSSHCFVTYKVSVNSSIPRSDRGADDQLKLVSFYWSWMTCSAPEPDTFIHLHPLTGCNYLFP